MSGSDAAPSPRSLLDLCRMRKLTIATAESCTGGLVAGALTDIPGSSDVIDRGFVTYSNDAKRAMLGVKATTLATFGAVSKETATAMAIGALEKAGVDLAVSITGIAGPGGATPGKPVGLVHFAVASRDGKILHREFRFGAIGRTTVRQRSVVEALRMLRSWRADRSRPSSRDAKREPATAAWSRERRAQRQTPPADADLVGSLPANRIGTLFERCRKRWNAASNIVPISTPASGSEFIRQEEPTSQSSRSAESSGFQDC
jgi:nicotinamide-nucleotide amidase